MQPFLLAIDQYLIWWYRLTGVAEVDFLLGTTALIFFCLLCGKATALLVLRCLHPQLEKYGAKAAKYQDLAMAALKAGDKEAYQNINRLANDAFGHTFFQQVALSAAYLWPVFFALAWLQLRFLDLAVPIPGTPWSLGFIGIFLLIYIGTLAAVQAVRRIWRRCRPVPTSVPPGPVVDTPPAC